MHITSYKLAELFILFVLAPIALVLDIPLFLKPLIGLVGFAYVVFVLLRVEKNKFQIAKGIPWKRFFISTGIKLVVIIIITTLYMLIMDKAHLFQVILNKPKLWVIILFIYSLFSVYPQELIFRTFFFQRYEHLIPSTTLFIFINAILFSLAHLIFRNTLVLVLTFLGGLLFAYTFKKTKSTLLVSIEHAIYGCWLFTVGMGNMLGFPS